MNVPRKKDEIQIPCVKRLDGKNTSIHTQNVIKKCVKTKQKEDEGGMRRVRVRVRAIS